MGNEPDEKGEAKVLDSWAVLAWLKDQAPAADAIDTLWRLAEAGKLRLIANIVNIGEVYYISAKAKGIASAELILQRLQDLPLEIRPASNSLVLEAARLKSQFPIAYADAFAAVTAIREKAPLVTGHPEFKSLTNSGMVEIEWVGR
jgi:uncharacterized protein